MSLLLLAMLAVLSKIKGESKKQADFQYSYNQFVHQEFSLTDLQFLAFVEEHKIEMNSTDKSWLKCRPIFEWWIAHHIVHLILEVSRTYIYS